MAAPYYSMVKVPLETIVIVAKCGQKSVFISKTSAPECVETIEKPLMSMVIQLKTFNGDGLVIVKALKKPSITMVPSKKFITPR